MLPPLSKLRLSESVHTEMGKKRGNFYGAPANESPPTSPKRNKYGDEDESSSKTKPFSKMEFRVKKPLSSGYKYGESEELHKIIESIARDAYPHIYPHIYGGVQDISYFKKLDLQHIEERWDEITATGDQGRDLETVFDHVNVEFIVQDTFVGNLNIKVNELRVTMANGYRYRNLPELWGLIEQIARDAYPHFHPDTEGDSYYKELDLKRIEKRWKTINEARELRTVFEDVEIPSESEGEQSRRTTNEVYSPTSPGDSEDEIIAWMCEFLCGPNPPYFPL